MPEPKMSSSSSSVKHIDIDGHSYAVGDLIDAKDTVNIWYNSVIRDINLDGKMVLVHYLGWGTNWDAWLDVKDGTRNVAPLNSECFNRRGELLEKEFGLVGSVTK